MTSIVHVALLIPYLPMSWRWEADPLFAQIDYGICTALKYALLIWREISYTFLALKFSKCFKIFQTLYRWKIMDAFDMVDDRQSSLMSVRWVIEFIKFFLSDRRRDIYSFVTINLLIICLSISQAVLFCMPINYGFLYALSFPRKILYASLALKKF